MDRKDPEKLEEYFSLLSLSFLLSAVLDLNENQRRIEYTAKKGMKQWTEVRC
jgi:hypothetical protein